MKKAAHATPEERAQLRRLFDTVEASDLVLVVASIVNRDLRTLPVSNLFAASVRKHRYPGRPRREQAKITRSQQMTTKRYRIVTDHSLPRRSPNSNEDHQRLHATLDLALQVIAQYTGPWEIWEETTREAPSICNADRGLPSVDIMSRVVCARGPLPPEAAPGYVRVTMAGRTEDVPLDVARESHVSDSTYGARELIMGMLSSCATITDACLAAIKEVNDRASRYRSTTPEMEVAKLQVEAARLQLEAAALTQAGREDP